MTREAAMAFYNTRHTNGGVWIPDHEVQFHPHSFADPEGRLFSWKGGLYRAITDQQAQFIEFLFRSGVVDELVADGLLVESKITDYRTAGYALVVRHRIIPFPSYPNEWCAAMLKDATLALIEISLRLARRGLTLKDAHPWNFLYDGGRPVWVDLNSIAPIEVGEWQAHEEFRRFCLNPLLLMTCGHEPLARLMLPENDGVGDSLVEQLTRAGSLSSMARAGVRALFNYGRLRWIKNLLKSVAHGLGGKNLPNKDISASETKADLKSRVTLLERMKREVEGIPAVLPYRNRSGHDSAPDAPAQHQTVARLIAELGPVTVLDVNGQAPWLAEVAKTSGASVVSFNTDSAVVTRHYLEARARHLPLLPLVMDFTKPTPARGLGDHWSVAASERFQSEMVLALGSSLEDATVKCRLNFEQIAAGLSAFSKRWVVAEFSAREERAGQQPGFDALLAALKSNFKAVRPLPWDGPSRTSGMLLLAEK